MHHSIKHLAVAILLVLGLSASTAQAQTTLVSDDFSSNTLGNSNRLRVENTADEWIATTPLAGVSSLWTVSGEALGNAGTTPDATSEGAVLRVLNVASQPAGESSLQISDGTRFVPKDNYPEFSWDVTPQYFMFGDWRRVLKPEEVESIAARTDFLCIEKSHGAIPLGAAELGAKHEAAAFKKIKPGMKVLFYFNSAYAWPFTSYCQAFKANKIDDHPELKKFLIKDADNGGLANRDGIFCFDVLNPEFRSWWVDTVATGVRESGCDGVFIDQMHGFSWLRPSKVKQVRNAMGKMMADLKKELGPDKILLGNNAHEKIAKQVLPVVDASMFEHYNEKSLSKENLLQDWQDMLRIAKAGKMSVFRIGVEHDGSQSHQEPLPKRSRQRAEQMAAVAKDRAEYYLACYLIGAQPYSYFQYGWGWNLNDGALHDFPELQRPLGAPKGASQRTTPEGWEFTRAFEHATVWVDTEKQVGKIQWK